VATTTIGRIAGPTATNDKNGENASAGPAVAKNGANGQHATEDGVGTSTGPTPTVTTTVETLTADLTLGDRCRAAQPIHRLGLLSRTHGSGSLSRARALRVDSTRKTRHSQGEPSDTHIRRHEIRLHGHSMLSAAKNGAKIGGFGRSH